MIDAVTCATLWLLGCAALFGALQHFFPLNPKQPLLRKDSWIDVIYWAGSPVIYGGVSAGLTVAGFLVIFGGDLDAAADYAATGGAWVRDWPLWAQALGVLVLTDISMYWTHRLFHTAPLWRFHAIHHAPEQLDFLHAVRFHPVNYICHGVFANALALWAGFPPAAVVALVPFNILYSAMVHANLNWTFGPLRYVFASPVFHRWHHTAADEGGSSNFAATFSCLDLLFGTWHMPEETRPMKTGITEADMPPGLVGQLLYPFVRKSRSEATVAPGAESPAGGEPAAHAG